MTLKLFHCFLICKLHFQLDDLPTIKIRKEKRLPKTLTSHEMKHLLDVASQTPKTPLKGRDQIRNHAILNILISCGLRICEIRSLNIRDCNPKNGQLLISGKNRKERVLFLTDKRDMNLMKDYLNARSRYFPSEKEQALFLNKYGARLPIYGIENIYSKYRNAAHLPHSTPHYLRHSFTTELLNNGANLRDIQELLGHSNITTTEIYVEVSSTRKRKVLAKFGVKKY